VHRAGHVRHQVHGDAQRRHPLEQLRACHQESTLALRSLDLARAGAWTARAGQ
jgi:hypothetical protein